MGVVISSTKMIPFVTSKDRRTGMAILQNMEHDLNENFRSTENCESACALLFTAASTAGGI